MGQDTGVICIGLCSICRAIIPPGRILCENLACRGEYQHQRGKLIWTPQKRREHGRMIRRRKRNAVN